MIHQKLLEKFPEELFSIKISMIFGIIRIFYAPYECTKFYYSMNLSNLFNVLRYLADKGAIVVLPVGSDAFLKTVVDECIYLDRVYE